MEQKSLKRNYILNMVKTVSGLFFPVVSFAYASRILGVDGIGKVDFSKSIVSYFTLFATLGISTYGIREGSKVRDDKRKLSKLTKELFGINVFTTVLSYVFFLYALFMVERFSDYRELLLINGLTIGFTALGLEWLYGALEDFEYITVRYILFQVLALLLLIVFINDSRDYYIYAFIITFSNVGSNVFNFIHARKYVSVKYKDKLEIKRHIKPIMVFFSNTLAGNIYVTLDTSMIGLLSTDYAVGLYSASIKMNRICIGMITALSTVLLPRLSYYIENKNYDIYKTMLKKSFDFMIMLSLPIAGGLFLLSKEVLVIFSGVSFANAEICSRILSVIVFAVSLSTFAATQILIPYRKEKYQLYGTIIGAISNLLANSILIPLFNQNGAALGTVIAESLVAISLMYFAYKCVDYRFMLKQVWHYFVALIGMLIVLYPLSFFMEGLLKCIAFLVVGAFVYGIILFSLRDECFIYIIGNIKNKLKRRNSH